MTTLLDTFETPAVQTRSFGEELQASMAAVRLQIKWFGVNRSVAETHYFKEAGTYSITIKTTDFNGNVNSTIIGTYTVKAREIEPLAVEDVALIEPIADIVGFTSQTAS